MVDWDWDCVFSESSAETNNPGNTRYKLKCLPVALCIIWKEDRHTRCQDRQQAKRKAWGKRLVITLAARSIWLISGPKKSLSWMINLRWEWKWVDVRGSSGWGKHCGKNGGDTGSWGWFWLISGAQKSLLVWQRWGRLQMGSCQDGWRRWEKKLVVTLTAAWSWLISGTKKFLPWISHLRWNDRWVAVLRT